MPVNEDALALMKSLVLHVAIGRPLSDAERETVTAMAVHLGAKLDGPTPPLLVEAVDADDAPVPCNAEAELDLPQIGMTIWLVTYLIRLSGDVDKRRRRVARDIIEFFETRKAVLGLDGDRPVLLHYLKLVPNLRSSERSTFLGSAWLPALFLRAAPDLDVVALDRVFTTPQSRLTLYKICYWFAAASGRRHAAVIDALWRIRSELRLESDMRCQAISAAIATSMGGLPPALRDAARSLSLADDLASRVVAGTVHAAGSHTADDESMAAESLVEMIPLADRLPALAHIFDVAMRETRLSATTLGCIARVVDAIDPSEGELTGILLRHELDSGRRIRLPRAYTIDYSKPAARARRARM